MTTERPIVACSMVEFTFFGGVYGLGFGEYFGALAGFCVDCSIEFGLPCSVRLIRAQPHAARVRWWPWAKFNIARPLVIEEVTEEQDRAA
jgi:hypothetical protein